MPAVARVADPTSHTPVGPPTGVLLPPVPANPRLLTVLIAGKPAAVVSAVNQCGLHPQLGPLNRVLPFPRTRQVLVCGLPLAAVGDLTTCGARIIIGAPTVQIGTKP
ncbi:PAAR domain-containing protein [Actinokineospora sp. NBRC 105648]|uniref:PAAR domain-containing protein n=1 Tax=Actinokineospora sp. NBRC 105648 TaxID=3032206 RepID=UPI0024A4EAE8|nr:PAAR domain-containing protein [Actinokineospora sp. NBRC 105648]GLZ42715.1 hypothetical protein Acsp05_63390 [Actinokineospora sp. NBRC 105648]